MSPEPVLMRMVGPPPRTVPMMCCLFRLPCIVMGEATFTEPELVLALRV